MRIRLLRPPTDHRAAFFSGPDHWKLTDFVRPRAALEAAWAEGIEISSAPWPDAIARALVRAGAAEVV